MGIADSDSGVDNNFESRARNPRSGANPTPTPDLPGIGGSTPTPTPDLPESGIQLSTIEYAKGWIVQAPVLNLLRLVIVRSGQVYYSEFTRPKFETMRVTWQSSWATSKVSTVTGLNLLATLE